MNIIYRVTGKVKQLDPGEPPENFGGGSLSSSKNNRMIKPGGNALDFQPGVGKRRIKSGCTFAQGGITDQENVVPCPHGKPGAKLADISKPWRNHNGEMAGQVIAAGIDEGADGH